MIGLNMNCQLEFANLSMQMGEVVTVTIIIVLLGILSVKNNIIEN